jgi:hypothetical protein
MTTGALNVITMRDSSCEPEGVEGPDGVAEVMGAGGVAPPPPPHAHSNAHAKNTPVDKRFRTCIHPFSVQQDTEHF